MKKMGECIKNGRGGGKGEGKEEVVSRRRGQKDWID